MQRQDRSKQRSEGSPSQSLGCAGRVGPRHERSRTSDGRTLGCNQNQICRWVKLARAVGSGPIVEPTGRRAALGAADGCHSHRIDQEAGWLGGVIVTGPTKPDRLSRKVAGEARTKCDPA